VLFETCWLRPLPNPTSLTDLLGKHPCSRMEELPGTYSKQLNMIYLKAMKRSPQERVSAQELLRTSYFLAALEKFISDEGLNIALQGKIPIKMYKIHRSRCERMKLKRGLVKAPSLEKKENLLPRIETHASSVDRKPNRAHSREKLSAMHTPVVLKGKGSSLAKGTPRQAVSTEKKKIKTEY
jgi:hypothetical protein